jgi:antitoxin component YwqK of YwqJK toxin-antitoxin module
LLLVVLVTAVICTIALNWDYIPGTFHLDQFGNPHGTGREIQNYAAGAPMVRAYYVAGELREKTWYKPDGNIVACTTFHRDGLNVSYKLRQDGTIESQLQCRYFYEEGFHRYFADGLVLSFRPNGSLEKSEIYQNGVPANSH